MHPRPVASRRPSEPPTSIGLPVTTPSDADCLCMAYVSMIHAMTRSLVLTSGAGMSDSGPSTLINAAVYLRVTRSSSVSESLVGSHTTPPFAPPNGIFTTAHFHVIHAAKALTSSIVTLESNRIPPFPGPRDVLWITRYPVKTSTSPVSS